VPLGSNVEKIDAREALGTSLTNGPTDISEGVESSLSTGKGSPSSATLYIAAEGAMDVTIEFSPDGGSTWYEPADKSPIGFNSAGEDVAYIEYDASQIRVTGSNSTKVNLDLRVTA